jgi:hypothetical protein
MGKDAYLSRSDYGCESRDIGATDLPYLAENISGCTLSAQVTIKSCRKMSTGAVDYIVDLFGMFMDLLKDIGSDELRKEAAIAWGLVTQADFSRENLKFPLTLMQTNRWRKTLDVNACDKVAGAILEFAKLQRPAWTCPGAPQRSRRSDP